MMPAVESLLAPVADGNPCGPDLSYSVPRLELSGLFNVDVSIAANGQEGQSRDIDWNGAVAQITGELGQTKDLALAVYLAIAGAEAGKLERVQEGVGLLAGLLERYWLEVHPRLEEVDVQGRRSVCEMLASHSFLGPFAQVPILLHPRLGVFGSAALIRFKTQAEADPDYGLFREALKEMGDGALQEAHGQLTDIEASLRQAAGLFQDKSGSALNLAPALALLAEAKQAVGSFFAVPLPADGAPGEAAPAGGGGGVPGRLNSREDVARALEAVMDYYRRKEPSSPVLPLLERAKAWVPMSFLDVLADIAPDSMNEARRVLSRRDNN